MSWQSFEEVHLSLAPMQPEPLSAPLSYYKDWLNGGGAVKRVKGPYRDKVDRAELVVHSTLRAIAVKWDGHDNYGWSRVHHTPYETLLALGWDNPHSEYVRIPTPDVAQESLPGYVA